MNLNEFLERERYQQNVFAEMCGICPATIGNILKGKDYHLSIAAKMIQASKGKITATALIKAIKPKAK